MQAKTIPNNSPIFSKLFSALSDAATNTIDDYNYLIQLIQSPIQSDDEVIERAEQMDEMFDQAKSETDLYFIFANLIADRIEEYEQKYLEFPTVTGRAMLSMLMKEKGIKQSDLIEITPQGNISDILNGKRKINLDHAKGFATFFKVPMTVFID